MSILPLAGILLCINCEKPLIDHFQAYRIEETNHTPSCIWKFLANGPLDELDADSLDAWKLLISNPKQIPCFAHCWFLARRLFTLAFERFNAVLVFWITLNDQRFRGTFLYYSVAPNCETGCKTKLQKGSVEC